MTSAYVTRKTCDSKESGRKKGKGVWYDGDLVSPELFGKAGDFTYDVSDANRYAEERTELFNTLQWRPATTKSGVSSELLQLLSKPGQRVVIQANGTFATANFHGEDDWCFISRGMFQIKRSPSKFRPHRAFVVSGHANVKHKRVIPMVLPLNEVASNLSGKLIYGDTLVFDDHPDYELHPQYAPAQSVSTPTSVSTSASPQ
jgi:hypothetical protein